MRVLIGHDGSSHADDAIDDLRWAGLPAEVEALVVRSLNSSQMTSQKSLLEL